jgi:hypothetical protein
MVAKNPKPNWWRLYALLPLSAVLLVGADLVAPSAGWRMVAEGAAALLILGLMALWVRANRLALALPGKPSETEKPLRAWVAYCPPGGAQRNLALLETTFIQHHGVRTEAMQEDVACCAK